MTTMYKPVKITSAEQAEALPEGTLAFAPFEPDPELMDPEAVGFRWANLLVKYGDLWEAPGDGGDWAMHELLVGWSALVPVEAEEERSRSQINITHFPPPAPQMVPVRLPCPRCGLR